MTSRPAPMLIADDPKRLIIWTTAHSRGSELFGWLARAIGAVGFEHAPFGASGVWGHQYAEYGEATDIDALENQLCESLEAHGSLIVQPIDDHDFHFHAALASAAGRTGYRHLLFNQRDALERLAIWHRVNSRVESAQATPARQIARLVVHARRTNQLLAQVRQYVKLRRLNRRAEMYEALFDDRAQPEGRRRRWNDLMAFAGIPVPAPADLDRLIEQLAQAESAGMGSATLNCPIDLDALRRELAWIPDAWMERSFLHAKIETPHPPEGPARIFRLHRIPALIQPDSSVPVQGLALMDKASSAQGQLELEVLGSAIALQWPTPSLKLGERLARNPRAANSGFRGPPQHAQENRPWRFLLRAVDAPPRVVATVQFQATPRSPVPGILLSAWSIGYQAIPKVACTSIKEALFKIGTGASPTPALFAGSPHVHEYLSARECDIGGAKFKFVVVRDPVKRFLSGFSNRVLHHKELSVDYLRARKLDSLLEIDGFVTDPTLEYFVQKLDLYLRVPTIRHHFQPMCEFVSPLEAFDKVYAFEEMPEMCREISRLTRTPFKLPHSQRAGPKISTADLSRKTFDKVVAFYENDFALLRNFYAPSKAA